MTEKLIKGLQRFQSGYYRKHKSTFEALASSQAPPRVVHHLFRLPCRSQLDYSIGGRGDFRDPQCG